MPTESENAARAACLDLIKHHSVVIDGVLHAVRNGRPVAVMDVAAGIQGMNQKILDDYKELAENRHLIKMREQQNHLTVMNEKHLLELQRQAQEALSNKDREIEASRRDTQAAVIEKERISAEKKRIEYERIETERVANQ